MRILWSEFNEFKTVGPYVIDWKNEQFKGPLSHYISTVLLTSLQSLNLFWLYHIFRIAYRFAFENIVEDDRSDNDEKEVEEEQTSEIMNSKIHEKANNQKTLCDSVVIQSKSTGSQCPATYKTGRTETVRRV